MKKNLLAKAIDYIWLHVWQYRAIERRHRKTVAVLRSADRPIRVVFIANDVAYWHYQGLYRLMAADTRFLPTIVLSPCLERLTAETDIQRLRQYFRQLDTPFIDYDFHQSPIDMRRELQPDLIFYTQPYEYQLCPQHDCRHFYDRLVCYMPYAFWTFTGKSSYNLHFQNQAWRLYYPTRLHLEEARLIADNHGRNVRVTGYTNADEFLADEHPSPWRTMADGLKRKRIIWAPHFTITWINSHTPPRSNFLWMAQLMVTIAREYGDRIQLAFKPHPSLRSQLYKDDIWGKERTDQYYALWEQMPNTQLETGQYTDLFMNSDAMIHDSGSFAVEYHYTKQPVMFVSKDMEPMLRQQSRLGILAFKQAYIGSDEADIRRFIDDVVLGGNDPMRPQREQFYNDYLLPPGGKSVARNILDDIIDSIKKA